MTVARFVAGKEGVYPDIPDTIYHDHPACSNSRLSVFRRSPAHLRWEMDHSRRETPALRIGRATHMAWLEPDRFFASYKVWDGERRSKAGKEEYQQLVDEVGEEKILKRDEYDQVREVAASAWAHPFVQQLLTAKPQTELSMLWSGTNTPLCKGRIDAFHPDYGIVDFKTTDNASPEAFSGSLYRYGYHRQAAFYVGGAARLGLLQPEMPARFTVVAVEKSPPYCTAIYEIAENAIIAGSEQLAPLLARYRECEESGLWPAYGDLPQPIDLPAYAYRQIYDSEAY